MSRIVAATGSVYVLLPPFCSSPFVSVASRQISPHMDPVTHPIFKVLLFIQHDSEGSSTQLYTNHAADVCTRLFVPAQTFLIHILCMEDKYTEYNWIKVILMWELFLNLAFLIQTI